MSEELVLKKASPFDPEVLGLMAQLDEYQQGLYPAESNHLDSPSVLAEPNCRFVGAYKNGKLVGIGAAKIVDNYGELKRFFVPESNRGMGIAECMIGSLEKWLLENKVWTSHLETGIHQPAAIRFYNKLGYEKSSPFGNYKPDPLSVFMTKDLTRGECSLKEHRGPYSLVIFTSHVNGDNPEYSKMADQMDALVMQQPGYLGMHSNRNSQGEGFTASYWVDREAIRAWKNHSGHQQAIKMGKEKFYTKYRAVFARVES